MLYIGTDRLRRMQEISYFITIIQIITTLLLTTTTTGRSIAVVTANSYRTVAFINSNNKVPRSQWKCPSFSRIRSNCCLITINTSTRRTIHTEPSPQRLQQQQHGESYMYKHTKRRQQHLLLQLLASGDLNDVVEASDDVGSGNDQDENRELSTTTLIDDTVATGTTINSDDHNDGTNIQGTTSKLKVSDMKQYLKERNVNYSDCFDYESLLVRYHQVLQQQQQQQPVDVVSSSSSSSPYQADDTKTIISEENSNSETSQQQKENLNNDPEDDNTDEKVLESIKQMTIRELREELGQRRISRVGLLEKSDLVNAIYNARRMQQSFSISGTLIPGTVTDITDTILQQEMNIINHHQKQQELDTKSSSSSTKKNVPLLLIDVYATWCGPCKMMIIPLQEIAQEYNTKLRVVKMDSDQYPNMSSQLKVQGLPTFILYNSYTGTEVQRLEGAYNKQQLIDWIEQYRTD